MIRGVPVALALACTAAHAEPEGYRGGKGRPPGTAYAPEDSVSLTVRAVTVRASKDNAGRTDDPWVCGGVTVSRGTDDLVTVVLEIANPTTTPLSDALANFDLVLADERVLSGSCNRTTHAVAEGTLAGKRRRNVRVQFLAPHGAKAKTLVYNDDDFPALFALPKAKRR